MAATRRQQRPLRLHARQQQQRAQCSSRRTTRGRDSKAAPRRVRETINAAYTQPPAAAAERGDYKETQGLRFTTYGKAGALEPAIGADAAAKIQLPRGPAGGPRRLRLGAPHGIPQASDRQQAAPGSAAAAAAGIAAAARPLAAAAAAAASPSSAAPAQEEPSEPPQLLVLLVLLLLLLLLLLQRRCCSKRGNQKSSNPRYFIGSAAFEEFGVRDREGSRIWL